MILVYHDVHSVAKLQEVAKIAFAFGVDVFVISRAQGNAAQTGVPEVHMKAYKKGVKILVVPDLKDAVDLLRPDKVLVISKRAEKEFSKEEVGKNTMIVVSGSEPDISLKDSEGYEIRYVEPKDVGEIGATAIILSKLRDDEADNG